MSAGLAIISRFGYYSSVVETSVSFTAERLHWAYLMVQTREDLRQDTISYPVEWMDIQIGDVTSLMGDKYVLSATKLQGLLQFPKELDYWDAQVFSDTPISLRMPAGVIRGQPSGGAWAALPGHADRYRA